MCQSQSRRRASTSSLIFTTTLYIASFNYCCCVVNASSNQQQSATTSTSASETVVVDAPMLQKCCEFQQLVQFQLYPNPSLDNLKNCARCQNLSQPQSQVQLQQPFPNSLFERFQFTDRPLLSFSTSSNCQFQVEKLTFSVEQLRQNLTNDGFLRVESLYFPTTSYCIDRINSNEAEVLLISQNVFQINKCCRIHEVFDLRRNACVFRRRRRLTSSSSRSSSTTSSTTATGSYSGDVQQQGSKDRFGYNSGRGGRRRIGRGGGRNQVISIENQNPFSSWTKYFETNYSFSIHDNWIGETNANNVITSREKRIQNFTTRNCWSQHTTRFTISLDAWESNLELNYESNDGVFIRGAWKTVLNEDFCLERIRNPQDVCSSFGKVLERHELEENDRSDIVIFFYIGEETDPSSGSYAVQMGLVWLGTSVFLFTAAIINVVVIQRNVHGWVLFSYLMTSALLNVVAGIFIIMVDKDKEKVGCNFMDFLQKFLYLSTLCWMTSINFDLWYAFRVIHRKLEPTVQNSSKRFPFYVLFSWGLPILIIAVGWYVGTQKKRSTIDGSPILLPHCIIYDYSIIFYMSSPVVVLVAVNLLMFIRTVIIIHGLRNASKKILQRSYMERES